MIDTVSGYVALINVWRGLNQPVFDKFIQYMIRTGRYEAVDEHGYHIPSEKAVQEIEMKINESRRIVSGIYEQDMIQSGNKIFVGQTDKVAEEVQ